MEGFPFLHRERARRGDCDPRGHVNNAAYSTFLEQAVLVGYDYARGESVPVPAELKERLRA